jgi:hypothetical protein
MAVTFTTSGASEIVIGGEINPANGLAGPFPRYSISKEIIKKDTLYLGVKYSISINGTALINTASSMLVAGDRQNQIHDIIKTINFISGKRGTLEIAPYGGASNILQFTDAYLVSSETPEQDETSQGVQSQDYSFTFEAFRLAVDSENIDNEIEVGYDLQEVSESWDYSVSDGENTQASFDEAGNPTVFRNYTISHTISATGQAKETTPGVIKSGYIEAKNYVDAWLSQIGNDPFSDDVVDHSRGTPEKIDLRDKISDTGIVHYNQVNTYNKDILEGSYSVSRTWTASKWPATCTIDFNLNQDPTAEFNSVDFSANITGHQSFGVSDDIDGPNSNKYQNAKDFLDTYILNNSYTMAQAFYAERFPLEVKTLRTAPTALSQSHNQTDGSISITATYDDSVISTPGVISQSVNITYTNEDGLNQIIAILPVIAKTNGPVIQDMSTTQERQRSISLDWVMDLDNRATRPSATALAYIEANHKPITASNLVYRQNKTESWNPSSGSYSLSVDYTWTDEEPTN